MILLCALGTTMADESHVAKNELVNTERIQTKEQALSEDINILSKEIGAGTEEIRRSLQFQDQFTAFFETLLRDYPNQISRVWLDPVPASQGYVEFVGDMPEVRTTLNVDFTGGGVYSFQEQEQRAEYLAQVLVANDLTNFISYFNHKTNLIKLQMKVEDHKEALSREALDRIIASEDGLDEDERVLFDGLSMAEIEYEIEVGRGDIIELLHSRGGHWLRRDGLRRCTSGWSVSGPNGDGIVTAGHCTALNQFEESPVSIYGMKHRKQNFGKGGDSEYHTTVHIEPAEYWASPSSLRPVESIRPTIIMIFGMTVCGYGRSSDIRSCNHQVVTNNIATTMTGYPGVVLTNMLMVTGVNSIPGDSGGPWSWSTTAWGILSGMGTDHTFVTPVQQVQTTLGVTIKTQ